MASEKLEYLRIVSEGTACLRDQPHNAAARRRRDESIRLAARHHSVREIAEAAGIGAKEILDILEPAGITQEEKSARWRRRAPHFSRLSSSSGSEDDLAFIP